MNVFPFGGPKTNHINETIRAPQCSHLSLPLPKYDESLAKDMSTEEVRRIFPRTVTKCPDCGYEVILYNSFHHYLRGGW